jgi:hypothetical protein
VEEHAAVAVAFTAELERKLKIFVGLLGLQIAVVLGKASAVDDTLFDRPALVADLCPARRRRID